MTLPLRSPSAFAAPPVGAVPAPKARDVLELLKPITWFPPMWAFMCGVVASGVPLGDRWHVALAGILLAGPLLCAMSQAVNDWYDRHVDAINEPDRPIPSGRIPGDWGLRIAIAWTAVSLAAAWALGPWVLAPAAVGVVLAWAYSAPPVRLKRDGWWGNAAVAGSYEGLPWITGTAVMVAAYPDWRTFLLAGLYSLGAHGIMTLNDFKSIEGDRRTGVASLPVQLGVGNAALVASAVMLAPQVVVVAYLADWGAPVHAAGVAGLMAAQVLLMARFLKDPKGRDVWYSGFGVPLYVLGMLVSAFALRGLAQGAA
jgi:chlorophyll synthase